ncbi:MAG: hypothetical protein AB7N24_17005 [Dehalococcoidia bacterium]
MFWRPLKRAGDLEDAAFIVEVADDLEADGEVFAVRIWGIAAMFAVAISCFGCENGNPEREPTDGERTYSDVDWGAAQTLPALIEKSPVIVQGILRTEETDSRLLVSPNTNEVAGERVELVRTFELTRVLRGPFSPKTEIVVRAATSSRTWDDDPSASRSFEREPTPMEVGREYVLFLTTFSPETGADLGPVGVVSAAAVNGDELVFLAPSAYLDELADGPMESRGKTGLGASFDVTAQRLAELVVALPERPATAGDVPAVIDARTRNGQIAFDLAASSEQFADGDAIVRRLAELGFSAEPFQAEACYKIETVLAEAKNVTLDLGCPE